MSERKVLNKYYPPDFDPSAIPKMKQSKNRTFNIRIMAPCNMRCNTCREYIYKGKKFNSRKENVEDEYYLGLRIFRFYIKCPKCVSEIAFKTDLKNTDYTLEAGATRLFEAEKIAQQMAEKERKDKEDEELNNPMKILENRTEASRNEIEQIDTLEELREINARQAKVDYETMLAQNQERQLKQQKRQEEEEEREIKAIFGEKDGLAFKRLKDDEDEDNDEEQPPTKKLLPSSDNPTDIFAEPQTVNNKKNDKKPQSWERSVGGFSSKKGLVGLVKKKVVPKIDSVVPDGANNSSDKNSKIQNSSNRNTKSENSSDQNTYATNLTAQNVNKSPSESATQSSATQSSATQSAVSTGLGLLGGYSDSESEESDN